MNNSVVVCLAVLVAVVSASYPPRPPLFYGPSHRGGYGGAGGLGGGGLDPLTLLLLQKDGGLGKITLLLRLVCQLLFRRKWWYQQSPPSSLGRWWTRWEGKRSLQPPTVGSAWRWEVCREVPWWLYSTSHC